MDNVAHLLIHCVSVYTWGPLGLIARRGVSVRDGYWDPDAGDECEPDVVPGEFVPGDTNTMRDYTYMSDHMGNIAALVDNDPGSPTFGTARRQVFDAFGNNVGGYITFQCASDHNFGDQAIGYPPPCPLPPAQPIERMQTGSFNWRGAEGSITDRVAEDMPDTEENTLRWSAYTRPSTGLIYMQNRYYEPETGRFTQADPMPYEYTQFTVGQNNRWSYCANDPANHTDPSGMIIAFIGGLMFGLGFAAGYWMKGAPPPPLLKALLDVLAVSAGSAICALEAKATLAVLIFKSLAPFAVMFGLLATFFVVGMLVGYLIASNVEIRDREVSPSTESWKREPQDTIYLAARPLLIEINRLSMRYHRTVVT